MLSVANSKVAACIELARAIAATGASDELYGLALTAVEDALDVSRAALLVADGDGVLRVMASRGLSAAALETLEMEAASAPEGALSTLADGPAAWVAALRADGVTSVALHPLQTAGRSIGTFVLCFDNARELGPEEAQLANVIASQVAFAVERWRTERALEVSSHASQHLAAIVESSGDAIVSKSLEGTIISWNRAAERMFGYTAAEVVGRSITIIIPADRLQEERTVLAEVRAGHAIEMETIRRRKDGSPIPIALTVSPIRDGHGRIVGASKVARDISVRVRVEAERADLHRRLRMLVGASASLLNTPEPEAVLTATIATAERLLDADGFAVWVSTPGVGWRAIRHAGVSDAFATRRIPAGDSMPAAASAPFAGTRAVADVLADASLAAHWAAYTAEGIRSMLVCPMSIPEDGAGTLVFYFRSPRSFVDADVETGQALANLAAAALRTAALHDRLRRECVAADEASRVKDEFLATLSHELRTPLNAILGYAQLLEKGAFDHERSVHAVAVLRRNAESLRQIIDDVLDVARITSGKLRLNVEPIDFAEVVRDAMLTVQPGATAKEIALHLHVAPELPRLWGDGDRLRQVAWNLLSNAVKFTQPGGHVRVTVDRDGAAVRLIVSDDGQGIEKAFLPHIFERFRQADGRFSREHGGLGLGLAIVRDLVELHGGTVSAESGGPGQGATFTVRLPPGSGQGRA